MWTVAEEVQNWRTGLYGFPELGCRRLSEKLLERSCLCLSQLNNNLPSLILRYASPMP